MASEGFTKRQMLTLLATSVGVHDLSGCNDRDVALLDIQSDFDAGEEGVQRAVAAYSLTMGMFIMSAATFADRRGRRLALIGGIVLFSAASAMCAAGLNLGFLNIGRGPQGVGAATVNVASLAPVSAAFRPEGQSEGHRHLDRHRLGRPRLGPTVGGVMTESLGWRSIFFVNVGIGLLGIVLVVCFVDQSRDPTARSIDLPGELLFIVAVGTPTYVSSKADTTTGLHR